MKAVSSKLSAISFVFSSGLLLIICSILLSCSIPNLEPAACIEARTPIREFFSFHFGNDMKFSQANLRKREQFLTADFASRLTNVADGADPFTTGDTDFPKAFRVGECRAIAPDKTEFQVLLFWKDDVRSEQREIKVVEVKQGDRWRVDDISAPAPK